MVILHIFGARAIILLFCDHRENESESRIIEIVQLDQYSTRKYQSIYGTAICISHMMGEKYCDNYLYLCR